MRSDRNAADEDAIEIDASDFSGSGGAFPSQERWRAGLLTPLEITARWAQERQRKRITLSGAYRLTTAFCVGWSFRSAIGFEIDILTRAGQWATDQHASARIARLPWQISVPERLTAGRLVVGVGVLRDPSRDIVAVLL